jgi:hypothetical protein
VNVFDDINPVVVGPELFAEALSNQGAKHRYVDWRPPLAAEALLRLYANDVGYSRMMAGNQEALSRLLSARCRVTDVLRAGEVIAGMEKGVLLHAGPPTDWAHASGPMRGALVGAVVYEGWAENHEAAERELATGRIMLSPCHAHDAVGPMAGLISPSMPVFVVTNEAFDVVAYSTLNEGLGKVLRYGANDEGVLQRLKWLAEVAGPLLGSAIRRAEGIDLTSLIAQALQMGDELHNRNKAATALFAREIAPHVYAAAGSSEINSDPVPLLHYLASTDVFFLNLAMAASKAALIPAIDIQGSTMVTAMARNGTDFGIWMSGTGREWFTSPAAEVEGLFFPGYGPEDANPDLGDSAITETAGLGGFALAAAPAIVQFIGGSVELGRAVTEDMYQITLGEHTVYQIPTVDFRGTPVGIDAVAVARSGVSPVLDTGIAHKEAGVGQIGAGIVRVPLEPFGNAITALVGRTSA